jgi:hypothetical protein
MYFTIRQIIDIDSARNGAERTRTVLRLYNRTNLKLYERPYLIFPVVKIFKFEHWTEAEIPPGLAVSVGSLKNTYLEKFGEFTTSCFHMLYKVFILFIYLFIFVYEHRNKKKNTEKGGSSRSH